MDVFDRYAPFVQDFIYEHEWESLRAIQVAAGEAIFDTDSNVLLTASTASGKTEAAFFPILTLFDEDPPASVGALYVGPLKALINDQFGRLNELCEEEGDCRNPLARGRQPVEEAEAAEKALWHLADHAGIPGIVADQ